MRLLLFISLFGILASCTKEETISGNTPPPDGTVEPEIVENYINRLHISLTGKKPDNATFQAHNSTLSTPDESNRKSIISEIQDYSVYSINEYEIARGVLLNSVELADIELNVTIIQLVLDTLQDPLEKTDLQVELNKIKPLLTMADDLDAGTINVKDMHRLCINNNLYDEINMGTENFVVSMFRNFLRRSPSEGELERATLMVDGSASHVFLADGANKEDFIELFFDSYDYHEGQVRELYLRYLYREPEVEELAHFTNFYMTNNNYQLLQSEILASDEFMGIK